MKKEIPADIQAVLVLHIGKNFADITTASQIEILERKRKRFWIMIGANLFALIFFSYSFLGGLTQISDVIFYILGGVFTLNMLLIFYQRNQVNHTLDWLRKEN